jgi:hypothetical protein
MLHVSRLKTLSILLQHQLTVPTQTVANAIIMLRLRFQGGVHEPCERHGSDNIDTSTCKARAQFAAVHECTFLSRRQAWSRATGSQTRSGESSKP